MYCSSSNVLMSFTGVACLSFSTVLGYTLEAHSLFKILLNTTDAEARLSLLSKAAGGHSAISLSHLSQPTRQTRRTDHTSFIPISVRTDVYKIFLLTTYTSRLEHSVCWSPSQVLVLCKRVSWSGRLSHDTPAVKGDAHCWRRTEELSITDCIGHRPANQIILILFLWCVHKSTPNLQARNLSKISQPIHEYIRYAFSRYRQRVYMCMWTSVQRTTHVMHTSGFIEYVGSCEQSGWRSRNLLRFFQWRCFQFLGLLSAHAG